MFKWILCVFVVLLMGCTNHLLIRDSRNNDGDYKTVARNIYQIAKTCWKQQEPIQHSPMVVESIVTLDSIIVSARFDPGTIVMNPFIRFVVMPYGNNNAKIDLYFQETKWIEQERHLKDAYNWLSGNYICSQLD